MASRITEAWSHDEGKGGRSVTGMHGRAMGKEQKFNGWHGNATSRHRSATGAWLHGYGILGHGKVHVVTKLLITPFMNWLWPVYT